MFAGNRKTLTTRHIRASNRFMLLQQLLAAESTNRQELSRLTGLSPATVNNLVSDLIKRGLVVEVGFEESQGGRPTTTFSINPKYGTCIGIDCSETYLHFELFDLQLRNLATHEIEITQKHNRPEHIVAYIADGLETLLAQNCTPSHSVVGVGVSIPGPFEHNTGVSVFAPYWGWRDVPIQKLLEKSVKFPLYLDNPLKFNAIAEQWLGAGRGIENFVSVFLGTGVGAGIVIDGALFRGSSNSAGEWGHTPFVYNGRRCRCGSRGCLEAYIGAPGLIQSLRETAPDSPYLEDTHHSETIRGLIDGYIRGDPVAQEVCSEYAQMVGAGLATLVNIINPELIVLGSWLAKQIGPHILSEVQEVVARYALAKSARATRIVISQFERSAVSIGGAAVALEKFLDDAMVAEA